MLSLAGPAWALLVACRLFHGRMIWQLLFILASSEAQEIGMCNTGVLVLQLVLVSLWSSACALGCWQ